jgi:hypothetical protein
MSFFADLDDGRIKVISRRDRAIAGITPDTYKAYIATLDEKVLGLDADAKVTRFVMRKILPYKSALKVKNAQISMKDGDVQPQLSFMSEEVRLSLIDIENPDVPENHKKYLLDFKRENDGGAGFNLMAILEAAGVVNDLYTARQNAVSSVNLKELDKKKSLPSSK